MNNPTPHRATRTPVDEMLSLMVDICRLQPEAITRQRQLDAQAELRTEGRTNALPTDPKGETP